MSGDFQTTRTSAARSGKRVMKRSRFSLLGLSVASALMPTTSQLVRKGRNPKTGSAVDVPEKRVPFFKVGKLYRFKKAEVIKWTEKPLVPSNLNVDDYVNKYLQKHVLRG